MATITPSTKIPAIAVESRNGTLQIAFANGMTINLDPSELLPSIRAQATLHGLKQKLVDAAAISRDTTTGRSATNDDKRRAVMEVYDRITGANATWNKIREGGTITTGGLLVNAMMQLTGKSNEHIVAYLAGRSNEEKAALRKNQKIAAIIEELKAAQVKIDTSIDTDGLLDNLMNDNEEEELEEEEELDEDTTEPNTTIDLD